MVIAPATPKLITPSRPIVSRALVSQTGNIGGYQLFQDAMPLKIIRAARVMSEDVHGAKVPVLRVGGQFQVADSPNANGRIYPLHVLRQAVEEIQEDVKARGVLSEWDHPPDAKIHLDRLCACLTKLWMEGKTVFGEMEILDDLPFGGHLKKLIERKIRIGVSSRGVGDMETAIHEGQEYYKVLPGYTFITFDVVAEPSVHGSYVALKEGRERGMQPMRSRGQRETDILTEMRKLLRPGK